MTNPALYQNLARYNQAMNLKVYAACAGMTDEERRADRGAFFGSIHSTLNHLLFGDRIWLGRLKAVSIPVPPIGTDIHHEFSDLQADREAMDRDLIEWADGLRPEWLAGDLEWTSAIDGRTRVQPNWLLAAHLFNHQTHHRGQLTTLLSQMGLDIGSTDIPFILDGAN